MRSISESSMEMVALELMQKRSVVDSTAPKAQQDPQSAWFKMVPMVLQFGHAALESKVDGVAFLISCGNDFLGSSIVVYKCVPKSLFTCLIDFPFHIYFFFFCGKKKYNFFLFNVEIIFFFLVWFYFFLKWESYIMILCSPRCFHGIYVIDQFWI